MLIFPLEVCIILKDKLHIDGHLRGSCDLDQGSPIPGTLTGTGLWPVRNWAAQQEVSGG